jgi:hypothetical protein
VLALGPAAEPLAVSPGDQEVLAALRGGNKIEAIKRHRERYKTSLREAKDAVDRLEAQLGIRIGGPAWWLLRGGSAKTSPVRTRSCRMRAVRTARLRGAALGAATLVLVIGGVRALPACDRSFEPPCRVVDRKTLTADDATATRAGAPTLTEGANGDVVAVSLLARAAGDGGVVEAGADGGAATFAAPGALVTVFGADGSVRSSHVFSPPSALRARRGSTAVLAVDYVGDGVFFLWRESSTTTTEAGVATTSMAVVMQHVALDGSEGPRIADPELTCSHCTLGLSTTAAGSMAALLASVTPDPTNAALSKRLLLVGFASDGRRLATLDLGGLTGGDVDASTSGLGGVAPVAITSRLTVQRGLLVARVGRRVALFDASLALRSGPHDIPTTEAEIDLEPGTDNLVVVYSASAVGGGGGALPVGGSPDLVYERRAPGSALPFASRRVSASTTALDLRRAGDRTGVVHLAGDERFFSLVEDDGTKVGGDLSLASAPTATSALTVTDANHFVVWSALSAVVREVVACDP